MNTSDICLNVMVTLRTVWNELSDIKMRRHCFRQDYLIAERVVYNK